MTKYASSKLTIVPCFKDLANVDIVNKIKKVGTKFQF